MLCWSLLGSPHALCTHIQPPCACWGCAAGAPALHVGVARCAPVLDVSNPVPVTTMWFWCRCGVVFGRSAQLGCCVVCVRAFGSTESVRQPLELPALLPGADACARFMHLVITLLLVCCMPIASPDLRTCHSQPGSLPASMCSPLNSAVNPLPGFGLQCSTGQEQNSRQHGAFQSSCFSDHHILHIKPSSPGIQAVPCSTLS